MSPMSQTSLARAPRSDPPARDTPPLTNTGTSIHLPSPAHGSPSSTTVVEKFRRATNVPPTVAPLLLRPRAIPLALTVWHTRVRTANLRPLQESLKVADRIAGERHPPPLPTPAPSTVSASVIKDFEEMRLTSYYVRPGYGSIGRPLSVLSNYFAVRSKGRAKIIQ
jgi:hypothetical protein